MVKNPARVASKKRVTARQKEGCEDCHHPEEKRIQIEKVLYPYSRLKILELFSGHGFTTEIFSRFGQVTAMDKAIGTGDSFIEFHRLIGEKRRFDVIDIDPYGLPTRFFPDVFLLFKKTGFLFLTHVKPHVPILSAQRKAHLSAYYGDRHPSKTLIIQRIIDYGVCHWFKVELIDETQFKNNWRWVFKVERKSANDF